MTAMIRGFDESLRDSVREIGPDIIFVQRFGPTSMTSGDIFNQLMKRPNLDDLRYARARGGADDSARRCAARGRGFGPPTQERVFYRERRTRPVLVFGTTENFAVGTSLDLTFGRFFTGTEVQYRKNIVVLGQTPYQALFGESATDPIGKLIRVGAQRYTVVGVFEKRPGVGGFNAGQDDFVVIP